MKECLKCNAINDDEEKVCVSCKSNALITVEKHNSSNIPTPEVTPPVQSKKRKTSFRESFNTSGSLTQIAIIAALIFGVVIVEMKQPAPAQKTTTPRQCATNNITCMGELHMSDAELSCKKNIENRARHGFKWSDSLFDPMFSRFWWLDKNHNVITYRGNKLELQNGLGLFVKTNYVCNFNITSGQIDGVYLN